MIVHLHTNKAFTLIEFVVIISIFAIIATIVLFNFTGFSSNISLSNLSHDVALVIRQAQVASGSSTTGAGIDLFNPNDKPNARGVYFEYVTGSRFNSNIILFQDLGSPNNLYTSGEDLDTITIQSTDYIKSIETGSGSGPGQHNPCTGDVHITFIRPDPTPIVNCPSSSSVGGYADIEIHSSDDARHKNIYIYPSGQIDVQ